MGVVQEHGNVYFSMCVLCFKNMATFVLVRAMCKNMAMFVSVWALCNNMEAACLERGSDVMTKFLNHPDENFRHCE